VNLAARDVRFQPVRFVATGVGLGLLFTIVLAMGGIYRGLVEEATLLAERLGGDVWLVQRDTRGPFAERSVLPAETEARAQVVPGVARARGFTYTTIQREHAGRPLRLGLVGLSWPIDRGEALPLVAGRPIASAHHELIADRSLGLATGERLELGDDVYTVSGVTKGMVSSSGDGVAFLTLADARAIEEYAAPESVRLARVARTGSSLPAPQGPSAPEPARVSAVLVDAAPGVTPTELARRFSGWPDVTAYTHADQLALLLRVVDKPRRQLLLFRGLLLVISAIVVSLILYGMTTARTHEIGILKLMGTPTRRVLGMIVEQALLLFAIGFAVAITVGAATFHRFPRRVVLTPGEVIAVGAILLAVCLAGSVAGIVRAYRIPANLVLAS